jgi:diguanylate cyclase (GGDEF)-like protein
MTAPISRPALLHVAAQIAVPAPGVQALQGSAFGPFEVSVIEDSAALVSHLSNSVCDVLVLSDDGRDDVRHVADDVLRDTAVVVVVPELQPGIVLEWLRRGAQDVLSRDELAAPSLPMRLRTAIERHRLARSARTAYATDLDTGLPHQQQLIEHMSQLIALREREPAPMALLALRIEGLATTEARLGRDASNALRRKVGVRLRAGVRASDVVASLGGDQFAVLLVSVLTPADAERVGAKLREVLMEPFKVAGVEVPVATAVGIGQYPQDGAQPDALLRRALGLAAAEPARGRAGFSNFVEVAGRSSGAANDD